MASPADIVPDCKDNINCDLEMKIEENNCPASDPLNLDFRESFYKALIEFDDQKGSQKKPWTKEKILEVINEIKVGRETKNSGLRRTAMEYYWMSKYDVVTTHNEDQLIIKKSSKGQDIIVLAREDYFDVLLEIHTLCKHGGRDKILKEIKNKYYVPKKAIELFVFCCPSCQSKRNAQGSREPIADQNVSQTPNKFNIKGLVDIIDFQACPDGEYKWLLVYQDDATKYLNLRPLKTNMAEEITLELIKIFLTFGAPTMLQIDNRYNFTAKVTENITTMWPACNILPKNTRTKECNEIEDSISSWMSENSSHKWSFGCHVVQYGKNNSYNRASGKSPYKTLFGSDPKTNKFASKLPASVMLFPEIDIEIKIELKQEPIPGQSSDEDI